MYKLSFAIVTRNRPESLSKTLHSISLQSLQPFEIVISDDSNDPINIEVNKKLAQQYNCIYILGPQKGLYANRNFVAKNVKGTHYRSVDDDHEFPDSHVEACMQAITSEPNTVWTIGEYNHTFEPDERLLPSPIAGQLHPRGFAYVPETFENYYGISCGATIYPKALVDKNLLNLENYRFGILFLEYGARLHFNNIRIKPLTDTFIIHNDIRLDKTADPPALVKETKSAKIFSMFLLSFHYQRTFKNMLLTTSQLASDLVKRKYTRQIVFDAYKEYKKTIKTNSVVGLKKVMKILVLSNCPLLEYQGSGYVIVNTISVLESLGHQVTAVPPSTFDVFSSLKGKGVIYRKAFGMARWLVNNRKTLYDIDLIIFYGAESYLALLFVRTFFRKRIKTLLHSNGLELHVEYRMNFFSKYLSSEKKWYSPSNRLPFLYCYKNVDAIITVSDYDRDFAIRELKLPADKVFANEPFLPDVFFQMNQSPAIKHDIITYCGSWIERKGVFTIQEAIPKILKLFPHYRFRLIGVGESFCKDKYFASEILDKIEVIPLVSDKKRLIDYYRESDIFLFPSFCESFGLVVAEAMICQCAVITGPTGIASTLLPDRDALVLEIPNLESVVKALRALIENKALKLSIQTNAPKRVYQLTKTAYTNQLNTILECIFK